MNKNDFLIKVNDEIKKEFSKLDGKIFDLNSTFFLNPLGKGIRSLYCYYLSKPLDINLEKAVKIASSAEITHLASLIHDDCIDDASFRRGFPTINKKLGLHTAILLGDLIVSIAFEKSKSLSPEVCFSLVDCVRKMVEGALIEEKLRFKIPSLNDYIEVVNLKTSSLFRWISITCGYISSKNNYKILEKISYNFGLSFQIIDDVIDIEQNLFCGKDTMKDLLEGKITYPVIIAMEDKVLKERIENYIETKDIQMLYYIREDLINKNYTKLAREKALKLIEDIKDDVLLLGERDKCIEFYNFAYSVVVREV